MNYQRIYEQLTAKDMIADYTEKHHIIPKCMGGSNDKSNLVKLTPEAHYVAHQLLVKIYPANYKLVFAANAMTLNVHGYRMNNKMFGWLKRKLSEAKKHNTMSCETKAKMKESHRTRIITDDQRAKMSNATKGKPKSKSHRAKIGAAHKGKPKSAEARANMSAAHKGKSKPKVICPHCNKEGAGPGMKRHHFDNCKHIITKC
jgi:hypothetical protein